MISIDSLKTTLGIEVRNEELFQQVFNHKSLSSEDASVLNNERLEFLGDAVLGLVVADLLYTRFPSEDEGNLSRKRASLVNESTLSQIAQHFSLADSLRAHHSQSLEDLKKNPRILASLFEAVVGALYLDSGFEVAKEWIVKVFSQGVVTISFDTHDYTNDYKTRYQELIQSKYKITPIYEMTESSGPDHLRQFTVIVSVNGEVKAHGYGTSKKIAAQDAAKKALEIEESRD